MNRAAREPGLFWPATWRLALAGAVFVLFYSGCNHFTATRGDVPTFMFAWEHHIPFVKELVIPYWSLDLFFCGVFFLCSSRVELNLLTKRLIAVTIGSCLFFLLFPLKMGLARPVPAGWTAPFFHALYANDLPYNLAPSLHISLRSLVWVFYGAHLTGWLRRAVKIWFILIGLSTLLLWQHHMIDVASGFVMGWAIASLIPDPHQPGTRNPSRKYALRYGGGALAFTALSFLVSVYFAWPAIACGIVALAYATGLSRVLGKENGTLSPSAEWCLLPILLGTSLVQRRWLRRRPGWHQVAPGLTFSRKVTAKEATALVRAIPSLAVLDLTAESNAPTAFREQAHYINLPLLDLVPLQPHHIEAALQIIRAQHALGREVFLQCQLGLQRSALIAAHWLVESGACATLEAAKEQIRALEPRVVI